jgi:NAD(P)-dependent dehydrogenase (short-subunit alcohol dehydrogenase family)
MSMGMLDGRIAVVTGGASGMGRAVAERFSAEGARVAVLDTNQDLGQEVADKLVRDGYSGTFFMRVDVGSAEDVAAAFAEIASYAGQVDTLVNCAGIREIVSPLELEAGDWERIVAVNLSGTFYCCQQAARQMVAKGHGTIVNISSTAGLRAYENRPAYSASKSGVLGLTQSLARDLAPRGIRVNCICPGMTRTPFTERYFEDGNFRQNIPLVVPMGRYAEPEEIASGALYLTSELSSYVSGAVLPIDGGHTTVATFNVMGLTDSAFSASTGTPQ